MQPLTGITHIRFGLFRVRSPLLAESLLMSFPPGTEMFQFPGFASTTYVFSCRYPEGWVAPFGYPRINACSRLPVAFRSVPRPSSPPSAKASTECPYHARYTHGPIQKDQTKTHPVQEPSTRYHQTNARIPSRNQKHKPSDQIFIRMHPHKTGTLTQHYTRGTNRPHQPINHHNASERRCRFHKSKRPERRIETIELLRTQPVGQTS